jgi:hypothetical protein
MDLAGGCDRLDPRGPDGPHTSSPGAIMTTCVKIAYPLPAVQAIERLPSPWPATYRVFEILCHETFTPQELIEFTDNLRQEHAGHPCMEHVVAGLSARTIRYRSLREQPLGYLPWIVWQERIGNCLGMGLLLRWICELLGIKSQGVLENASHYLLSIETEGRVRHLDRIRMHDHDERHRFTWRYHLSDDCRPLSLQEEIALMFQTQSCVSICCLDRLDAARAEAELALRLGGSIKLIRKHDERVKKIAATSAKQKEHP